MRGRFIQLSFALANWLSTNLGNDYVGSKAGSGYVMVCMVLGMVCIGVERLVDLKDEKVQADRAFLT